MVHILDGDKRKRIKFVDDLLERTYNDLKERRNEEQMREKNKFSIVERIKNDIRLSSEQKRNIIEAPTEPKPLNISTLKDLRIISKTDPQVLDKTFKDIQKNTQIVASKVVVDDEEIRKIFEK